MNNTVNRAPFLRTSREIPEELHQLTVEVNKAYVEIAAYVNDRTIGIFPATKSAVTGESWFISGSRQQTLRQVYPFTGSTLTIDHGITFANIAGFTRIYGTFLASGTWFPLPYVDPIAATNQIGIAVNATQILITGPNAVGINSGYVVLEWLSNT